MKFWIIHFGNRHGHDCFPCWEPKGQPDDWAPTLTWLLDYDPDFAQNWEGEDPRYPDKTDYRDDEYIETFGPFSTPKS